MQDNKGLSASVITTFPNLAWDVYAKKMLESFVANWPAEVALLVFLDDETLVKSVEDILRPQDAVSFGRAPKHAAFIERNQAKDDKSDYRKQACRFSHKVFFLKRASEYWEEHKGECRYLIWMDADVLTTRKVTTADIEKCLPRDGDCVSYLGRKDWNHSECGWIVFDLDHGGHDVIKQINFYYENDDVFKFDEWHDSFMFDRVRELHGNISKPNNGWTNLTENKPGSEIWPHSPMAGWSKHYKGPAAKQELVDNGKQVVKGNNNIKIQTKNSMPDEQIQAQIKENQEQINKWVCDCLPSEEEIVVVSAGPCLIAEDLQAEVDAGRRIVVVKHALEPLKKAGIKPWACILLDPRPHLYKFVEELDTDMIWFVASQVNPKVVKKLLDSGCNVWGYHASVGANEGFLTKKQPLSIVSGGSATATRGLFLLEKLGFTKFRLYGYELSLPDKPNMNEVDELNQPKYFEFSVQSGGAEYLCKKSFWTKAELIAQFEEMNTIIQSKQNWSIKAFGDGIIPFVFKVKEVNDLRIAKKKYKLTGGKSVSIEEMLWPNKNKCLMQLLAWWLKIRLKLMKAVNLLAK